MKATAIRKVFGAGQGPSGFTQESGGGEYVSPVWGQPQSEIWGSVANGAFEHMQLSGKALDFIIARQGDVIARVRNYFGAVLPEDEGYSNPIIGRAEDSIQNEAVRRLQEAGINEGYVLPYQDWEPYNGPSVSSYLPTQPVDIHVKNQQLAWKTIAEIARTVTQNLNWNLLPMVGIDMKVRQVDEGRATQEELIEFVKETVNEWMSTQRQ